MAPSLSIDCIVLSTSHWYYCLPSLPHIFHSVSSPFHHLWRHHFEFAAVKNFCWVLLGHNFLPKLKFLESVFNQCEAANQHQRWFCFASNVNSGAKMEPKNCVAFRVDKVGSQEPALDLYCSKNNLITGQQHPPICLLRPSWIYQTKQRRVLPSRGSFLPSCGADDECW